MSTKTKKAKLSGPEQVADFLETLEYPLKNVVEAVREIILSTNPDITEHIKWNAPSFCFGGEDRITMNLRSPEFLLLVFHRGAKAKEGILKIDDPHNLLTWLAADRATAKFASMDEVNFTKNALVELVQNWVEIV
jgi:hypothetical protein